MRSDDITSSEPSLKLYSPEEMERMWPQAAGELRGYANALNRGNAGITAAQMRMAVQMADLYLLCLKRNEVVKPDLGKGTEDAPS